MVACLGVVRGAVHAWRGGPASPEGYAVTGFILVQGRERSLVGRPGLDSAGGSEPWSTAETEGLEVVGHRPLAGDGATRRPQGARHHTVVSGLWLWPRGGSQARRSRAGEDGWTAYSHPLVAVGHRSRSVRVTRDHRIKSPISTLFTTIYVNNLQFPTTR